MADTIEVAGMPTGLTLTADLYPHTSDVVAQPAMALTEATNRKGVYTGAVVGGLTGWHKAFVKVGAAVLGAYDVHLLNDSTVRPALEHDFDVDPAPDAAAIQAAAAAALTAYDPPTRTEATADKDEVLALLAIISGYIDTEVAAIKAKTDNLPASPAAVGDAMTLTSGERDAVAAALLDAAAAIEAGVTPREALRLMLAALAGKLSGGGTSTNTFRNVGDTKNRIVATVDASGNRTVVTTDGA